MHCLILGQPWHNSVPRLRHPWGFFEISPASQSPYHGLSGCPARPRGWFWLLCEWQVSVGNWLPKHKRRPLDLFKAPVIHCVSFAMVWCCTNCDLTLLSIFNNHDNIALQLNYFPKFILLKYCRPNFFPIFAECNIHLIC